MPKLLTLILAGFVLAAASFGISTPAQALCVQPEEEGNWTNTDPDTRSITRINLRFICQDVILNGEPFPPGPPWYMHIWGACSPTDCNWGEIGAEWLSSGDFVYGFYDQGFAKRHVYAKMSAYRPGQLWVWMYTDFTDPGRPDYAVNNWFEK